MLWFETVCRIVPPANPVLTAPASASGHADSGVRNGSSYVEESYNLEYKYTQGGGLREFIDFSSARVAVGVDRAGAVKIVQVDGKSGKRGMNLGSVLRRRRDPFGGHFWMSLLHHCKTEREHSVKETKVSRAEPDLYRAFRI